MSIHLVPLPLGKVGKRADKLREQASDVFSGLWRNAMQQQRRRTRQTISLDDRLAAEAARLQEQALMMRPCSQRDDLLRKARQTETAAYISDWLRSPGLRAPT
jgi:hypothetical protein